MDSKHRIRSIRKGPAQWNEEDRLALASMLIKAGYTVRIGRGIVPGTEDRKSPQQEYYVEFWESNEDEVR